MRTLAIDTSNQTMALALTEGSTMIGQLQTTVNKNHSRTLMPAIAFLMDSVEWKPAQLERIVVAKGPGSYTGLRIGVTTAKTLAQTLAIPLVSVSSLAVLAANATPVDGVIVPIMDARRKNVYTGIYTSELQPLLEDCHMPLTTLLETLSTYKEAIYFVGKDAVTIQEDILTLLPHAHILTSESTQYPTGVAAAFLADQSGIEEDVAHFVPSYLKKVEAEEKWLETHQESSESYVEKL